MLLEKLKALGMVAVVCVDVGVQRPGVDQERYGRPSARRISSIRSEISDRPLAPAPAAISRRRPLWEPKCSSMASLVTSETVVARRSASWRRRASNSSGSLTVVLFTVCQHTIGPSPRCSLPPGAPYCLGSRRIILLRDGLLLGDIPKSDGRVVVTMEIGVSGPGGRVSQGWRFDVVAEVIDQVPGDAGRWQVRAWIPADVRTESIPRRYNS
jgi:hypothetical protein